MSFVLIASTYITLNFFVIAAFSVLKIVNIVTKMSLKSPSAETELRVHYMTLSSIIAIAIVMPFLPKQTFFQPAVKVWSAQSIDSFSIQYTSPDKNGYIGLTSISENQPMFDADNILLVLFLIAMLPMFFGLARFIIDLRILRKIRQRSCLIRKIRRISVFSNDDIAIPFSYWFPGHSYVIIPNYLLTNISDCKMVIAHELQHHRQADTKWVYIMWFLRITCFFNPFMHFWSRWLSKIQEFACDETLVDRKKVESRQYMRCLVEVAETALNQRYGPVCATGFMFLLERNLLKRRIEKMISTKPRMKKSTSWVIVGALVTLLVTTAFASQGLVQDRRVSLSTAQAMAANAKSSSNFPLIVNELVLTQLNRYIGTPEGREFMRKALQRMEKHRSLVEEKLVENNVPLELLAIPIVESGYQNLESDIKLEAGAGIWMFLAQTARNYGLRVDSQQDERLNVGLLSGAAARYLKGGNLLFNDWLLAVLGFNIGNNKVIEGIEATGSRDPWNLVLSGYENDKDYLAKVMATILIIRNPEYID